MFDLADFRLRVGLRYADLLLVVEGGKTVSVLYCVQYLFRAEQVDGRL